MRSSVSSSCNSCLGRRLLVLEVADGLEDIVAPGPGRLGGHRIVEMGGIVDAGALLLDLHLGVEIIIFAHEIGDHRLDIGDLPPFFFSAEAVQPEKRFS